MSDDTLIDLARAAGLMPQWTDAYGDPQTVPPQTLRIVLRALGFPADTDVDIADSRGLLNRSSSELPAMLVASAGARVAVGNVQRAILCSETGETSVLSLQHEPDGRAFIEAPQKSGYHQIELDGRVRAFAVAPQRCFTVEDAAPGERLSALAVQIYALRDGHTGGFGDLAALSAVVEQAASEGIDAVTVSPLHALMPGAISPYSPSTRYFYDALYADAALAGGAATRDDGSSLVDWPTAKREKMSALRAAFDSFAQRTMPADFTAFCAERGERLIQHARFEALDDHFRAQGVGQWRQWPEAFRKSQSAAVADFARAHDEDVRFHIFLQWLTARSLFTAQDRARESGMRIGLIADIAVGMDPCGSHAWSAPDEILSALRVGAPPDVFNTEGQNWGLTALSPAGFRKRGYGAFIDTLRAAMRYAGGVRIDHAMGLCRLWLIPEGAQAGEGVYLHYPLHDLLNLIALESHRSRAIVIGEDLGTVPEGFRPAAAQAGIMGMEVLWFQRDGSGFFAPEHWSKSAAALTTTHDLPTVAGWWKGHDIDWLEKLGRRSEHGDATAERSARSQDRGRLWSAFRYARSAETAQPSSDDPPPVVEAALDFVGQTPCALAVVPIEDVFDIAEQPNIPGTIDEHPNWRRRLPPDKALTSSQAQRNLARLRDARRRS